MMKNKIKKEKAKILDKLSAFFSDFKKFITKGNVLDLAVGVVIGTAFTAIVNGLVQFIITPLITWCTGENSIADVSTVLRPADIDPETGEILKEALTIQWGAFLQAIINFLIIAFVVFVLVRTVLKIQKAIDIESKITELVQKKLDSNLPLTEFEEKWLTRKRKKDPKNAPRKKEPEVIEEEKVPQLSTTDKILTEILEILKKQPKPE